MSNDAIQWILNDRTLEGADKALMFALAARANWSKHSGDDVAFPGWDQLQADAGLRRSTIANALKRLELRGYVQVTRDAGRGNSYYLPTPAGFWCDERMKAYGDRAPMAAPGSPAAAAGWSTGRPVRQTDRSSKWTRPANGPVKALETNESDVRAGATRPASGPVQQVDPYPSSKRTGPVQQTARPVQQMDPNHKNLKLRGKSESGAAPIDGPAAPVGNAPAGPVAGYAATTAGAKSKGKGKGKAGAVHALPLADVPGGPVAGFAATTSDIDECNAWLTAKGIRGAVH
jgi:DNA-binding MarR family transcriptional regulator